MKLHDNLREFDEKIAIENNEVEYLYIISFVKLKT